MMKRITVKTLLISLYYYHVKFVIEKRFTRTKLNSDNYIEKINMYVALILLKELGKLYCNLGKKEVDLM